MEKLCIIVIAILLAAFLLLSCVKSPTQKSYLGVEHYGGPVKNVKKIPMTDCYKMCDMNSDRCQQMYPHDNIGKCLAQWESCKGECYFSNAQRM